ncbi:hypothetical protein CUZ56_01473 [Saezia sanguinis]|uniref:Uncharacterized protein n=1 Tax=Saezia sanguinis TaxID=1965230 RepID=A0A433SFL9_9BURK|nr:hypothetical protein [Saezia sanguinis]RUS67525.1 hypothetical protein CUZ56_01473 [Saezia sanguinis]
MNKHIKIDHFLKLDVNYPGNNHVNSIGISDTTLSQVISGHSSNIEFVCTLLEEERRYANDSVRLLSPIRGNDHVGKTGCNFRNMGLTGYVLKFVRLFEQLIQISPHAAKREFLSWPNPHSVFSQLRIWAASKAELVPAHEFMQFLYSVNDEDFWSSYHQKDLMLTLYDRWDDLLPHECIEVVNRIIKGEVIPAWVERAEGEK